MVDDDDDEISGWGRRCGGGFGDETMMDINGVLGMTIREGEVPFSCWINDWVVLMPRKEKSVSGKFGV